MDAQERPFDIIAPRTTLASPPASGAFVPPSFVRRVTLHLLCNYLTEELARFGMSIPLLLGIQGRPGDGKSWQTRVVAARLGVTLVRISAAHLSSRWEGQPVQSLLEAYRHAASADGGRKAVLIDDLDTGLAAVRENRTYTVNSQLLAGTLMNLADDPEHVSGQAVRRTPIVATANDLSVMYSPLTRFGRMDVFTWDPAVRDRVEIVRRIFQEADLSDAQAQRLATLQERGAAGKRLVPVAFYGVLRAQILRRRLLDLIPTFASNVGQLEDSIVSGLEASPPLRSYDEIHRSAEALLRAHRVGNHLEVAA